MKNSPEIERLVALILERPKHVGEIQRVKSIVEKEEAQKAAILLDPNSLDDPTLIERLGRSHALLAAAPARLLQLETALTNFDEKLTELTRVVSGELHAEATRLENLRFERFCKSIAPFFAEGIDAKFFKQQVHSLGIDIPARAFFQRTDAYLELVALRRKIPITGDGRKAEEIAQSLISLAKEFPEA